MGTKYIMLSVDGGGIRGIIPARILQEIEERSGKPISKLFHFACGTSTGGIIVLGSSMYKNGYPMFAAKDMVDLYMNHGQDIFHKSSLGIFMAKYNRKHLDKVLKDYFGDAMLSDAAYPVAAVTYSLDTQTPKIWFSLEARLDPSNDAQIKDIAGATSAAPTYFGPKEFRDDGDNIHHEIDGGIFLNNPQIVGMLTALKYDKNLNPEDVLMVSVGTGSTEKANKFKGLCTDGVVGWLNGGKLIEAIMDASSNFNDMAAEAIYPNYYRLQVDIENKLGAMDNASPENMQALLDVAEEYIYQNSSLIDEIVFDLQTFATDALVGRVEVEGYYDAVA